MWTLLLITILSNDPPRIRYEPYAKFSTKEKCLETATLLKMRSTNEVQTHCVYDRN